MKKLFSMFALLLMAAVTTNVYAQGDEPTQTDPVEPEYYLVGSFNDWKAMDTYKLQLNTDNTAEYFISPVLLAAGDELKVIKVDGGTTTWYPADNYYVEETGQYGIYFRPNGGGPSDWYEGYIYVGAMEPAHPLWTLSVAPNTPGVVLFEVNGRPVHVAFENDEVTLNITPVEGYAVKAVTVKYYAAMGDATKPSVIPDDNLNPDATGAYKFTMQAANAQVSVEYEAVSTFDLEALNNAITEAGAVLASFDDIAGTDDIAGALQDAIDAAIEVRDNPESQEQIEAAVETLNQAVADAVAAVEELLKDPVTYNIAAGKYATGFFADNRKLDAGVSGAKLYTLTAIDGTTLTATEVTVVPANTPFLVLNESNTGAFNIIATQDNADNVTPIDAFKGTAEDKTFTDDDFAAKDIYVCTGVNFYWVMNPGQIAAHKCWLEFTKDAPADPSGAPALDIVIGEGTTHINATLSDQVNDNVIYDLSGRRVVNPTTGLYIMNGKKFVVK